MLLLLLLPLLMLLGCLYWMLPLLLLLLGCLCVVGAGVLALSVTGRGEQDGRERRAFLAAALVGPAFEGSVEGKKGVGIGLLVFCIELSKVVCLELFK